jgi:hypothetical protein
MGGVGDSPAPVGDSPTGTWSGDLVKRPFDRREWLSPFRPVPMHPETVQASPLGHPGMIFQTGGQGYSLLKILPRALMVQSKQAIIMITPTVDTKFSTTSGKSYTFRAGRTLSPEECAEHLRGISAIKKHARLKKGESPIIWLSR